MVWPAAARLRYAESLVMRRIVRKLHIYAGLLTFAHLIVYGIAGVSATLHAGPERPRVVKSTTDVPFTVPASATDREVANAAYLALNLPLTRQVPTRTLRYTPDHQLQFDIYNINGSYRVTVFENPGRLHVESVRKSLGLFFEDVHASTPGDGGAPTLVRAWAFWNEAAMWSLLGFCASGLYLWVVSRPRFLWAWVLLGAGTVSLALLWMVFRR